MLRLKCKVYETDGRQYLVSHAIAAGPEKMLVFVMNDEETLPLMFTTDQFNLLPYHWFEDCGPAPKAAAIAAFQIPLGSPTKTYELGETDSAAWILCLKCGEKSYYPGDINEKYCRRCRQFHDEPPREE